MFRVKQESVDNYTGQGFFRGTLRLSIKTPCKQITLLACNL